MALSWKYYRFQYAALCDLDLQGTYTMIMITMSASECMHGFVLRFVKIFLSDSFVPKLNRLFQSELLSCEKRSNKPIMFENKVRTYAQGGR